MVNTVIDLRQVLSLRDHLFEVSSRSIQIIAPNSISDIRKKTAKGKGADNSRFDEYSQGYLSTRKRHGRSTRPADLFLTGHTIEGLDLRGNMITVRAEDAMKAYVHNFGIGNQPVRFFLGIGPDTNEKNEKILVREIQKIRIK